MPILIMPDGAMAFGEGELASTHILKFGMRPEMHMMFNEFVCMELARQAGLPVARVSLQRFGEPVLVVERFDRFWNGKRVERRHVIDGCQMLDLPPAYKYERPFGKARDVAEIRTGASLAQLFAACRLCRVPARAIRDLLNWVLFQLLIGNSDAHGKNISYFVARAGIEVAPFYDSHLCPGDIGVPVLNVLGDMVCSFTDDLYIPEYGIDGPPIIRLLVVGHSMI